MYEKASGQLINSQSSCYLAHSRLPLSRHRVIQRITQFSYKQFPVKYLGCPLYIGRCKVSSYSDVCQSIINSLILEVSASFCRGKDSLKKALRPAISQNSGKRSAQLRKHSISSFFPSANSSLKTTTRKHNPRDQFLCFLTLITPCWHPFAITSSPI